MTQSPQIDDQLSELLRLRFLEKRLNKFLRGPANVRNAAGVIVTATALTVAVSAVLMWVLDHKEFHTIGVSLWWALQTVTTVGYGDVTPKALSGRLVGAFVMLEGTALIAIITAAITSTFIDRARTAHEAEGERLIEEERANIDERFDDLALRMDRIETLLRGTKGLNQ
jgi:voltage-gated potassium channel Kch